VARDILRLMRPRPVRAIVPAVVLPLGATLIGQTFLRGGEAAASLFILAVVGAAVVGGL